MTRRTLSHQGQKSEDRSGEISKKQLAEQSHEASLLVQ